MNLVWLLIIVLIILMVVGSPYAGFHSYGYGPSGIIGIALIILVILLLMGRL